MKATIQLLDSGTGELHTIHDYPIKAFDGPNILDAIEQDLADAAGEMKPEYPAHKIEAWVPVANKSNEASFILSTFDPYFGQIHVTGIAYLHVQKIRIIDPD